MLRLGLATTAHTEKDGGKTKTTPETLKDRGPYEGPEELCACFERA